MTKPMDPRMARSREALKVALLALLEEKDLDAISVRELTAAAGVGYATFFRNYPALSELLRDIARDAVGPVVEHGLPLLFGKDRKAAALALCLHVDQNRKLWTTLLSQGGGSVLREQFAAEARRVAEQQADLAGDLPVDLRLHFGVRGAVDIIAWWLLRRSDFSAEEVAAFLDRLVIQPTD
jgi:AcrR family transcriptional regulator